MRKKNLLHDYLLYRELKSNSVLEDREKQLRLSYTSNLHLLTLSRKLANFIKAVKEVMASQDKPQTADVTSFLSSLNLITGEDPNLVSKLVSPIGKYLFHRREYLRKCYKACGGDVLINKRRQRLVGKGTRMIKNLKGHPKMDDPDAAYGTFIVDDPDLQEQGTAKVRACAKDCDSRLDSIEGTTYAVTEVEDTIYKNAFFLSIIQSCNACRGIIEFSMSSDKSIDNEDMSSGRASDTYCKANMPSLFYIELCKAVASQLKVVVAESAGAQNIMFTGSARQQSLEFLLDSLFKNNANFRSFLFPRRAPDFKCSN